LENRILARKLAREMTANEINLVAGAATLTCVQNASGDINDGDDTTGPKEVNEAI
jgi:hypothetical protein